MGGSTGINVAGAIRLAKELGRGHTIVTILADYGSRYQSKLFNPEFLRSKKLPVPDWLERKVGRAGRLRLIGQPASTAQPDFLPAIASQRHCRKQAWSSHEVVMLAPELQKKLSENPGVVFEDFAASEHNVSLRAVVEALPDEFAPLRAGLDFIDAMNDIFHLGRHHA